MLKLKVSIAALCLLCGSAAQAGVIDLGTMMGGANIYTLGNFSAPSSDVEGALVSGGNVNIASYSVNDKNRDAYGEPGYALVVRNNLTLAGGSINNGKAYVGGTSTLTNAATPPMSNVNPIDFDASAAYYRNLSSGLSAVGATGTVSKLWSGVVVSGSGKGGVDVFNVSADMFRYSSSWTLDKVANGQTLIFNVSGDIGTFNEGGISFQPLDGYNVLFNFFEATQVNVKGVIGSVLAPKAAVTAQWGVINGNVIVDSWSSTIQVNANHYFKPTELAGFEMGGRDDAVAVSEPGSVALLLAGLGLIGFVSRRRQNKARG